MDKDVKSDVVICGSTLSKRADAFTCCSGREVNSRYRQQPNSWSCGIYELNSLTQEKRAQKAYFAEMQGGPASRI